MGDQNNAATAAAAATSTGALAPTITSAKAQKITSLHARILSLEAEIATTQTALQRATLELLQPPRQTVATHIARLHSYNEIRDVGQGLVGLVAENRAVRVRDVYEEFGVVGAE